MLEKEIQKALSAIVDMPLEKLEAFIQDVQMNYKGDDQEEYLGQLMRARKTKLGYMEYVRDQKAMFEK